MSFLEAVVLGLVQGVTEFIPISSSGHLVLVPEALGWDQPGLTFDVLLHVASLIALLVYFSGDLIDLWKGFRSGEKSARRLVWLLFIGSIPAAIAGLLWAEFFEEQFEDAQAAAIQLIITALILVAGEQLLAFHERRVAKTGGKLRSIDDLRAPDAGAIGAAQALSILPGISRSGATIATGLGVSMARAESARFAFLLAIPALFGAALVKLPDMTTGTIGVGPAIGGFLASLVASYAAIWGLIRYLKTRTLYPFAAYCVIAGIFFLIVI
jgi:undecaprenyl-diphosphatase